jgi:hypothetical protein
VSKKVEWKLVRNTWVSTEPVLPGVWQRKEGGHVVRARVMDATTGKQKDIWKVLLEADGPTALKWLEDERRRVREGRASEVSQQTRFSTFAGSLFEHKLKVGDIKSAAGRNRWVHVLKHLIEGVTSDSGLQARGFGQMFLDKITIAHVEAWKEELAAMIAAEDYAPATANGWLAILRVIMKAAKRQHSLPFLATEGVSCFDEC